MLGTTLDGHPVIEGELSEAVRDGDEPDYSDGGDDLRQDYPRRRQTLGNQPLALLAPGGYLPAEDAMEQAAAANRAHRSQLRRR